VIVVVGVFIGIQVANWNDTRVNRTLEVETLSAILTDLQADETSLQRAIAFADVNIEAGNYALSAAGLDQFGSAAAPLEFRNTNDKIDAPAFLDGIDDLLTGSLWSRLVVRYFPSPNDSAFSTLVATGRLGLITDSRLVDALQNYSSQWGDLDVSQNATLRPFRSQTVFVGQKYGLSPFGTLAQDDYLKLLKDHLDLRGAMRTHLEYVVIHRTMLAQTLELTKGLLPRVEEAVGKRS
jgi:hypothetical protein